MDNLLRVQAISLRTIEVENQAAPLTRHALQITAGPLVPGPDPVQAAELLLVMDDSQLHRLRHALLELDLAPTSVMPPPEVH